MKVSWNMRGSFQKYVWNWNYGGILVIVRNKLHHVNMLVRPEGKITEGDLSQLQGEGSL